MDSLFVLMAAGVALGSLLAEVEFLSRWLEQRCLQWLVWDLLSRSDADSSNDFIEVVGYVGFLWFLHILIHIVLGPEALGSPAGHGPSFALLLQHCNTAVWGFVGVQFSS